MQEHSSAFASVEHAASLIETDLATRPLARLGVVSKHRRLAGLACVSPKMREITDLLERVARTDVTLTLVGETGAGKDVLASAVHASARANGPFVVFDCGAVAANLAESGLLGHERQGFPGAVTTHAGAFEQRTAAHSR
jgi:transcriptional regulator with GAF, ATPase, and Fis domain